jgi:hypothetical protein
MGDNLPGPLHQDLAGCLPGLAEGTVDFQIFEGPRKVMFSWGCQKRMARNVEGIETRPLFGGRWTRSRAVYGLVAGNCEFGVDHSKICGLG